MQIEVKNSRATHNAKPRLRPAHDDLHIGEEDTTPPTTATSQHHQPARGEIHTKVLHLAVDDDAPTFTGKDAVPRRTYNSRPALPYYQPPVTLTSRIMREEPLPYYHTTRNKVDVSLTHTNSPFTVGDRLDATRKEEQNGHRADGVMANGDDGRLACRCVGESAEEILVRFGQGSTSGWRWRVCGLSRFDLFCDMARWRGPRWMQRIVGV